MTLPGLLFSIDLREKFLSNLGPVKMINIKLNFCWVVQIQRKKPLSAEVTFDIFVFCSH